MSRSISASSFRSLLHCSHALFLDHHGDPAERTELSEFEELSLLNIPSSLLSQHLRASPLEARWTTMMPHRSQTEA